MNKRASRKDDFIAPAKRAFRRVAARVRAENAKLNLPIILGDNGRVKRVLAKPASTGAR